MNGTTSMTRGSREVGGGRQKTWMWVLFCPWKAVGHWADYLSLGGVEVLLSACLLWGIMKYARVLQIVKLDRWVHAVLLPVRSHYNPQVHSFYSGSTSSGCGKHKVPISDLRAGWPEDTSCLGSLGPLALSNKDLVQGALCAFEWPRSKFQHGCSCFGSWHKFLSIVIFTWHWA